MTKIKAFRGLRPKKGLEEKIASLPYDVMSSSEATECVKENPLSFLTVTKSESTMGDLPDIHVASVYEKARENLLKYIENKDMVQDNSPCYYLYKQKMGEHVQTAVVAAASVDEYRKNIIKKHELTRADKELDRINHIKITKAQTGCVFLTYRNLKEIDDFVNSFMKNNDAVYSFEAEDGIAHELYVVDNKEDIAKITKLFEKVDNLYIADGHHRTAAAMKVADELIKNAESDEQAPYNWFLSFIFPDNMLKIMDYNRLIKDLNGYEEKEFLAALKEKFEIENISSEIITPSRQHQFAMYLDKKWYCLNFKEELLKQDVISKLDVSVLQDNVLAPMLDIKDPRKDQRIDFVGGIRGLKELAKRVDSGEFKVAFALYATSMKELFDVADADMIMPPKSTWFEPKIRDGLVVHLLE